MNTNGTSLSTETPDAAALAQAAMRSMRSARSVTPREPIAPSRAFTNFTASLEAMLNASPEFKQAFEEQAAFSARQALAAHGEGSVPSTEEFLHALRTPVIARGGTVARAFWWGFHIEISHQDLQSFLSSADPINAVIGAVGGGIPSPAAPFIALAAAFVAGALGLLRGLDRGRGVYVSMSWFALGIFIPTSV